MMAKKRSERNQASLRIFWPRSFRAPPAGLPPGFCTYKTRQARLLWAVFFYPASSPWSERLGAANQRRAFRLARLCFRAVRPDDSAAAAARCRIIALLCFLLQMPGSSGGRL
ncbi:hypothetical protein M441DRAFT_432772 [Trichoderma asperellum CBS 433.97]|uniref:Uncharacterized protein n=1 Tax=Trichoderma asperellum (strain ATCC 204424 / CBS 433.97 / NBRC 101777) TaxID=1042311 RepID=A0A2T3Z2R2_TRIA4|nr:hypothetical protein M441DRAFT_432772 [Trichoderma asperellum CBS 433.97]PTB39108.1 hypothetical protein M441DRAFT_432772 [Trichoderma asperellum CBS 433.97]